MQAGYFAYGERSVCSQVLSTCGRMVVSWLDREDGQQLNLLPAVWLGVSYHL